MAEIHGGFRYRVQRRNNNDVYADASRTISWRSQQTNMRRRQHNFIQSLPRVLSLTHFKLCLENDARYDNLTHHSHGSMQLRFRTQNDLGTVAVMGDSELINKFDPNSTMYIGTTNTILPAGLDARETLIIVLLNRNHAFGVSWAFMPDRSEVSFNAALDIACSQIAPLMNPTKIYYDYEQRLNDSLRANIPGATLKGTFLAYANVMIRRATLLNVDLADVNNQIIFKKLLAVALLPAASIVTGFLWLRSNIPGELIPIFEDLFVYYQDNLINLLGPENLSFYNDVDSFSDSMKNHIFNLNTLLNNNNSVWNCLRIFVN
ncbi:uncharacterized protein LOC123274008 isoform X3 [Cotesia glomerata]|uniref:uncharacterized protein LOC123274008 isoform X3 n=1 Tax=Cotesia glomerata TaxID=32391 RepID=UPI001D014EB9|nr:uncharacterized protein LOC123274008 isoform X3 [Cotesia glomerata]